MKKILALILAVSMLFVVAACSKPATEETTAADAETTAADTETDASVMTYEEYAAAEIDSAVCVETYVQAKQSWWNDKACLYLQDADGAYFIYNAVCSQEDYGKLAVGTKIKVTGKKAEWKGEMEVGEGATFVIEDGSYIAKPFDATALLGNDDELIKHQNKLVAFKGLTVAAKKDDNGNECAFFYGYSNEGEEGSDSDLYFDVTLGDQTYTLSVEYYLCDETTDVYQAVQNLKVGDKIDVEGFLYWYSTQSTQVTSITVL